MSNTYILTKNHRIKNVDFATWAKWFELADRIIEKTVLPDGKLVSTVFLALNYNFGVGKPLFFETMVFKNSENLSELDTRRYSTYREALKGHGEMVKKWSRRSFRKKC